jgi:hypothetical protein
MPRSKISEYSATANSNTDVAGINVDEGCAPSGINNAIRAVMGHLKDFQAGTNGDSFNGPVGTSTAAAGAFTTLSASGNVTLGDASSDTLNVGNGGIVKDASGNVGIGTSSPIGKFSAQGPTQRVGFNAGSVSSPAAGNLYYETDGTGWQFQFGKYQSGSFTAQMCVTDSGNVGIGTSSPASKLNISGAGPITFRINDTNTNNWDITNNSYLSFTRGSTEAMRIDSSGNLLVGTTTAAGKVTVTDGLTIYVANSQPYTSANAAATVLKIGSMTTGRSISSAGTNNASGADYAEYMVKCADFTVAKGDIVGINAQGKLTNIYADAVSFAVKSTNPSYVGGDTWGSDLEGDALEEARQTVDRIAFAGQVPVNVTGATAGQYIVPVNDNGAIKGEAVSNPTFEQYQQAVGKVIAIEQDGRARIIVKVA